MANPSTQEKNGKAAGSRTPGTAIARKMASFIRSRILTLEAIAILGQAGSQGICCLSLSQAQPCSPALAGKNAVFQAAYSRPVLSSIRAYLSVSQQLIAAYVGRFIK